MEPNICKIQTVQCRVQWLQRIYFLGFRILRSLFQVLTNRIERFHEYERYLRYSGRKLINSGFLPYASCKGQNRFHAPENGNFIIACTVTIRFVKVGLA